MRTVAVTLVILATLSSGLVCGVYLFYARTVMPGLARAGDRTFVAGFQALELVTTAVTVRVNLPANERIKAAGDVDAVDATVVRAEFDERRWVRWNLVRVVLSFGSFAALTWATHQA